MTSNRSGNQHVEAVDLPLETKLWRLSMILAAAKRIHSSLSLDSVLDAFLDIATGEVGASGGSIYLRREEDGALVLAHSHGPREMSESARPLCCDLARQAADLGDLIWAPGTGSGDAIVTLPLRDESKANIGVLQIYCQGHQALEDGERLFLTELSHFASLSIRNARYHEDSLTKAHLDSEIGLARDIQSGTLPKEMPEVPGYDVAGLNRAAEETSGDSFDLIVSDEGDLTILLADATGHGIGPALSVTQVRSMLRVTRRLGVGLFDSLKNINDQLCADLATNLFVTACIAHLEADTHQLRYHSAGQGPLLLWRAATGETHRFGASSPPLGLLPINQVLTAEEIELEPGDTFAAMTDGVFEAENEDGEMLGEDPVIEILRQTSHLSCDETARRILETVDVHCGESPQADDITIVLLRRNPRHSRSEGTRRQSP